jgi:hypothetical protein
MRPKHGASQNARTSSQPLTRDAWVAEFVSELLKLRPDLSGITKFANQVAQVEYPRQKTVAPAKAAKVWNERVKCARP